MSFLIESPHTKAECLKSLDEISAMGEKVLSQFSWGCTTGDHTGYAVVTAKSENEAKSMVPSFVRNKAKVVQVEKFNRDQVKAMHEM